MPDGQTLARAHERRGGSIETAKEKPRDPRRCTASTGDPKPTRIRVPARRATASSRRNPWRPRGERRQTRQDDCAAFLLAPTASRVKSAGPREQINRTEAWRVPRRQATTDLRPLPSPAVSPGKTPRRNAFGAAVRSNHTCLSALSTCCSSMWQRLLASFALASRGLNFATMRLKRSTTSCSPRSTRPISSRARPATACKGEPVESVLHSAGPAPKSSLSLSCATAAASAVGADRLHSARAVPSSGPSGSLLPRPCPCGILKKTTARLHRCATS